MIYASVPVAIRRNNRIWIKKGTYEVVRRFDDTRWLIELEDSRQAGSRTITLINGADMRLSTERGEQI